MANMADTAAGRTVAENLVQTRMASKTWVNGHVAIDKSGHTIVRFQRFMATTSAATRAYGAWVESRADDAT
jgi:hypothetical protein